MSSDGKIGASQLLFTSAGKLGMHPSWVIPDRLFAVTINGNERYINRVQSSLNSTISASLGKNKYMARLILERHGVPNIPFARPESLQEAEDFLATHHKIIVKPVGGSGSHDIHIVTTASQLQELDITLYILEKYVLGNEMRYLILNGAVIAVHESKYGVSVEETRELQRISYSKADWDPQLIASSTNIAQILGLRFAAVDYLVDADGKAHFLEINAAPGLKWFHAPTSGPIVDVARLFLEAILKEPASKNSSASGASSTTQPALAY